jgi:hypothetical protein
MTFDFVALDITTYNSFKKDSVPAGLYVERRYVLDKSLLTPNLISVSFKGVKRNAL